MCEANNLATECNCNSQIGKRTTNDLQGVITKLLKQLSEAGLRAVRASELGEGRNE